MIPVSRVRDICQCNTKKKFFFGKKPGAFHFYAMKYMDNVKPHLAVCRWVHMENVNLSSALIAGNSRYT